MRPRLSPEDQDLGSSATLYGLDAALTHYRITTTTRPLEDDEEDGAVERIKVLQSSQLDLMFANDAARAELAVTENNRSRIDAIRASL